MSVNSKMTAIADAIRSRAGGTETLTLDEMAILIQGLGRSQIIVTAPTGSTVTAAMGGITKTAAEKNGVWTFKTAISAPGPSPLRRTEAPLPRRL